MNCSSYVYSNHAISQMFSRGISVEEVEGCIKMGNKIKEYLEDKPYPSFLILYFMNEKPIHIVVSQDISSGICYIITAYLPDQMLWDSDFKNKR